MRPGDPVVIRFNPFHGPGAENIVGTVLSFSAGTGFMGCDMVEVEYENPRDGQVHILPFGAHNLEPANPAALFEMAERYEALAAELRGLGCQAGGTYDKHTLSDRVRQLDRLSMSLERHLDTHEENEDDENPHAPQP